MTDPARLVGVGMAPLDRLIRALAQRAVAEYLTPKPASDNAGDDGRTNRADLPATNKAA